LGFETSQIPKDKPTHTKQRIQWWNSLKEKGWQLYHSAVGQDGFRVIACYNKTTNALVIAYRGTADNGGVLTDIKAIWGDEQAAPQQIDAFTFVKDVLQKLQKDTTISM